MYWEAWHHLRYDRQYGAMGGESPILFTAIDAYGARFGFDGTEFDILIALVREMDAEYLDWLEDRRKADEAAREAREKHQQ